MHALITGASSGIGEALARSFAQRHGADARLTLVARRRAKLEALAADLAPARCHVIERDLATGHATLPALVHEAEAALGPLDVLVNNAGLHIVATHAEASIEDGVGTLLLNLHAPLLLTRAVLPGMLDRRRGTIVDITSMAALTGYPGMTWYAASKAGLAAASEVLRREVVSHGVHVLTVYPGPVHTEMGHNGQRHFEKAAAAKYVQWGTPEELALRILKAIDKKQARVVYPRTYAAAGAVPWLTRAFIDRFAPLPDGK
ncbi:MAG: SDR family NAD(P)-dependent oxidoreductase [Myxococcales bacterium]|nr:SDR family NAD(P)-dependent oxidoreductase [Myxococcales bacterium]